MPSRRPTIPRTEWVDAVTPDGSRTFAFLLALLALAAAAKPVFFDSLDPDLFWHLRVGEQLLRDGIGPIVDTLSFSSSREPWTPYSWLAELFMLGTWEVGGYRLSVLVNALTNASLVLLLAAAGREAFHRPDGAGRLPILLATAACTFLSLPYLSFRPVSFALVLLAVVHWLLWRDRRLDHRSRGVWWVPPILALGINLHLFAVIGVAMLAIHLVASTHRRRDVRLLLAGAVACLATPMLPGLLATAWHYQARDVMVASGYIAEMQPIWTGVLGIVMANVLGVVLIAIVRRREDLSVADWITILLAVAMVLRLGRFMPVAAILLVPLLTRALAELRDRPLERWPVRFAAMSLLVIGTARIAMAFPWSPDPGPFLNRLAPPQQGYPVAAADYVARQVEAANGRLINEFGWGGFLAWRLGDRYQVLLDGRTQVFPREFWLSTVLGDEPARRRVLADSRADAAILPVRKSLFRESLLTLGWRSVHRDEIAEVLVPPRDYANLSDRNE